jgi:DNA-binding transcriptional ArsR family regulator
VADRSSTWMVKHPCGWYYGHMDLARPYQVLSPSLDPGVLTILAGTSRPLTGREISRLLGRSSHSGVIAALDRLVIQGLVDREEAGRAFLFTLNREHLAAAAAELLADLRGELLHRIRDAIDAWSIEPAHLSLFGSAARGDGDSSSDIDVFVVRRKAVERQDPLWREQLDLLIWQIERWTGNPARIAEVGQAEIARLREDRPALADALRTDAISLVGPEAASVLGEA